MSPFRLLIVSLLLLQRSGCGCASLEEDYLLSSPRPTTNQIAHDLASFISHNSTIISPSDPAWQTETERYQILKRPDTRIAVRPAAEEDVAKIVQYANSRNIQFYAQSRGHSLTVDIGRFDGIEIDLRGLADISINPDDMIARFQGGVHGFHVIETLFSKGYVTATGTCSCVSLLGPALGGGHGVQQGRHGLTMDQFVRLNVVLANGTAVSISEQQHPDLWWAFRGAGHNFGIVTSFHSNIYHEDVEHTYFSRIYRFAGTALEGLFEAVNAFNGNGTLDPIWLINLGLISINESLSNHEATIMWQFIYDGPQSEAETHLKPFDNLDPLAVEDLNIPYPDINAALGSGLHDPLCQGNQTHITGTAGMQVYNVTAMRQIYDLFNRNVAAQPGLSGARVLVESYSVEGVKRYAAADSAFPQRHEYILTYVDIVVDSAQDARTGFALRWRDETVELWNAGQPGRLPSTYVNYAAGYEALENMYGHEPWRLEKLRALKAEYDPHNRFAYYNPII